MEIKIPNPMPNPMDFNPGGVRFKIELIPSPEMQAEMKRLLNEIAGTVGKEPDGIMFGHEPSAMVLTLQEAIDFLEMYKQGIPKGPHNNAGNSEQ